MKNIGALGISNICAGETWSDNVIIVIIIILLRDHEKVYLGWAFLQRCFCGQWCTKNITDSGFGLIGVELGTAVPDYPAR